MMPYSRTGYGPRTSMWDSPGAFIVALMRHTTFDYESGCYIYESGSVTQAGYRQIHKPMVNGKRTGKAYVHRAAHEVFNGPLNPGEEVDHVRDKGCSNPACWRPAHLEPCTHKENMRRLVVARRAAS